jgi:hypothetical protein
MVCVAITESARKQRLFLCLFFVAPVERQFLPVLQLLLLLSCETSTGLCSLPCRTGLLNNLQTAQYKRTELHLRFLEPKIQAIMILFTQRKIFSFRTDN